jgi:hypothetical protein
MDSEVTNGATCQWILVSLLLLSSYTRDTWLHYIYLILFIFNSSLYSDAEFPIQGTRNSNTEVSATDSVVNASF